MSKKKKNKKYIEVEKVVKLPHCQGKKCNRFAMFRESCEINSCFFLSEEQKKQYLIEKLAQTLQQDTSE
jgi:hypothetical protein